MSDDIIDFYKKATEPLEEQIISEPIIEDNIPTPEEPFDKFLVQLAEKLKTDKKPEAIEKALEQTALETTNEGDDTFAKFLNNFAVIVKDDKNVRKDEIVKEATIDFIDKLKNEKIEVVEPVIEVTKPVIKRSHKIPDKFKDKIPVVEDVSTDRFFNREETTKENKYVNELKTADKSKKIPERISKNTDLKALIEKQVRESVSKIKQELGHELMTAGGGGTVAVQYANGGTMNGDLNVTGRYLSGGTDIATIFAGGGGGSANILLAGSQQLVLNTDGSISFPNNVIRPPDETVLHLTSETNNLTSYTELALSPYGFFAYDGNSNSITFDSVDNAITLTTLNSSEWIFDKNGYLTGPNNVLTINGNTNVLGNILSGGRDLITLFNAASGSSVNVTFLSSVSSNWNSAYNIATVYANNSALYTNNNTFSNTLTAYTSNTTTNALTSRLVTTPALTNTLSAYTTNNVLNNSLSASNNWNNAYTLLYTTTATSFKVANLSASGAINTPKIDSDTGTANLYASPTTVTAFGAANTINLGYTNNTGSSNTFNIATQAQAFGSTKTVNVGTGSAANSTTNVNIGSTSGSSIITTNGNLLVTKNINTGTNTYVKTVGAGDISLDNSTTDTPGVLLYYGDNTNWGIDSWNGSFGVLSGQLWRVTNNLNESGGAMKMAVDTTGNIYATGFIQAGAYRAGQVIKDTMLMSGDLSIPDTTVGTSTSDTDLISYSYTPTSNSSYLIIHVHVARYSALAGTGTDSWFSRIKVDGTEIVYAWQSTRTNDSSRTGCLFPLTGRYTNSNTTAKTITVGVRRDTADDSIIVDNNATAISMRITEIAR